MRTHAVTAIAVAAVLAGAGCAPVSQQEIASRQDEAFHIAIDFQRKCDARSEGTTDLSLLTRIRCMSGTPLPPECEKTDTDDLPGCRDWFRGINMGAASPINPGLAGFWAAFL